LGLLGRSPGPNPQDAALEGLFGGSGVGVWHPWRRQRGREIISQHPKVKLDPFLCSPCPLTLQTSLQPR
jgi:hypothetical protein